MKDATIILRVEETTKDKLQKKADKQSVSLSNYIRLILEKKAK